VFDVSEEYAASIFRATVFQVDAEGYARKKCVGYMERLEGI
jgi:hypothetical protein